MTQPLHRVQALGLLNRFPDLNHREAGFLGHCAVAPVLSEKQSSWLNLILERRGMTALAEGGE